jgi:hypothetical protein
MSGPPHLAPEKTLRRLDIRMSSYSRHRARTLTFHFAFCLLHFPSQQSRLLAMKLFPSDRLFEEAAQSPESAERLMAKLRKARMNGLVFVIGEFIVFTVLVAIVVVPFYQWLDNPSDPWPQPMAWLVEHPGILSVIIPPILITVVLQVASMLICDAHIKMLLFTTARSRRMSDSAA